MELISGIYLNARILTIKMQESQTYTETNKQGTKTFRKHNVCKKSVIIDSLHNTGLFLGCSKDSHDDKCRGMWCHCHLTTTQNSGPSPLAGKQLPPGFSMGHQPHSVSPPPVFQGQFPPVLPFPAPKQDNGDIWKKFLEMSEKLSFLESKCNYLEAENGVLKQHYGDFSRQMQCFQNQLDDLTRQNAELVKNAKVKDWNKAGKTAAIQHPKPKHYVNTNFNGDKKPKVPQSEGGDENQPKKKYFGKPYKGKKKIHQEPPKVSEEVPEVSEASSTEMSPEASPKMSPQRNVVASNLIIPGLTPSDLESPSNWGDSAEDF